MKTFCLKARFLIIVLNLSFIQSNSVNTNIFISVLIKMQLFDALEKQWIVH